MLHLEGGLHRSTIADGVRLLVAPMRERASASIAFLFDVGSRREKWEEAGIAHFMEHIVFKGGRRHPTARAISEAIESVGGSLNASTDRESTQFWTKVPGDQLATAVDVLTDMLFQPALDPDEVAKERQVVVEELRMYADNPQDHVHTLFDEVMWPEHPLGWDIAGREETVRAFTAAQCREHLQRHYRRDTLVISVAGAVEDQAVRETLEPMLAQWSSSVPQPSDASGAQPPSGPPLRLENRRTEQANIVLGTRSVSYLDPDRFAVDLLNVILGEGMSSRLFLELRERRGLVYDIHSFTMRMRDSGALAIYCGCEPRRAVEAATLAIAQLEELATHDVAGDELLRAKSYFRARLLLQLEGTGARASFYGQEELAGGDFLTPEEITRRVEAVTVDDIRRAAETHLRAGVRAAVVGPFQKPARFEALLERAS